MPSRATERINFGRIKEIIAPPNLIELQTNSYREFLQADQAPSKRKNLGLQAVFTEVFPIESYDGKCVLDFHSYEIGEPKVDWLECLREGLTFRALAFLDGETGKGKDSTKGTDEEILKLFYDVEDLSVREAEKRDDLANKVLIEDVVDQDKNLVIVRAFEPLSKAVVKQIGELGV